MHPVLFAGRVAGVNVQLQSYTTLLTLGLAAGLALALLLARGRGLPLGRSAVIFGVAVAMAPVGARIFHVATAPALFREDPVSAFELAFSGLGLYGGLAAAVVAAAVTARMLGVDLWRLADAAAPGIALGIVFAKLGCLGAGCCHGVVTRWPLGVVFPLGSPAHGAQILAGAAGVLGPVSPVLPNQLYEAAAAIAIGVAALWLWRRGAASGVAFLATAAGFSAVRLALQPLRWIHSGYAAPSWFNPVLYVAIIVLCSSFAGWRVRRQPRALAAVGTAAPGTAAIADVTV